MLRVLLLLLVQTVLIVHAGVIPNVKYVSQLYVQDLY
jgi:hypothetical protein